MRHLTLKDLHRIRPMVADEVNYILKWKEANPVDRPATTDQRLEEWEELLARLDEEIKYLSPTPRSKIVPSGA